MTPAQREQPITHEDVNRALRKIVTWLVGTGLIAAFGLGMGVKTVFAKIDTMDAKIIPVQQLPVIVRTMDSLKIEMQHLTRELRDLANNLDRSPSFSNRPGPR